MKKIAFALAIALVGFTLAQEGQTTATSQEELRQEAMRLSLLNELPEDARPEAEALLERVVTLQDRRQDQETAWLTAYVEALRDGETAAVARELADQAVAEENLELLRQAETLREDLRTFVQDNPEAAQLLWLLRGPDARGNRPFFELRGAPVAAGGRVLFHRQGGPLERGGFRDLLRLPQR